jgi:hypothetical protein
VLTLAMARASTHETFVQLSAIAIKTIWLIMDHGPRAWG